MDLNDLATADPITAGMVVARLKQIDRQPSHVRIAELVEDTIWGLSQEIAFGRAIAEGYCKLFEESGENAIDQFREEVRKNGHIGPTLGGLMAVLLVPVLNTQNKGLIQLFLDTVETMLTKGNYTLKRPLTALGDVLHTGDSETGIAYLKLLRSIFQHDLTYNQAQHYAEILPQTLKSLPSAKRLYQINQLHNVVGLDIDLTDHLMHGFENGLYLLSPSALKHFVARGTDKYHHQPQAAKNFFALVSKAGLDVFQKLQTNISVKQILPLLNRYVQARLGQPMSVQPMSQWNNQAQPSPNASPLYVCSDGRHIYLKDEIDDHPNRQANVELLKCLLRLEIAPYEYHTYDFDLDKFLAAGPIHLPGFTTDSAAENANSNCSDMTLFWQCFPNPRLAEDLMTIFEQGRLRLKLMHDYPGMVRRIYPLLQETMLDRMQGDTEASWLTRLYYLIVINGQLPADRPQTARWGSLCEKLSHQFSTQITHDSQVGHCAQLVVAVYDQAEAAQVMQPAAKPLCPPFGLRLRPDLFLRSDWKRELFARQIKKLLADHNIQVFKSDLKKHVHLERGLIDLENVDQLECIVDPEAGLSLAQQQHIIINTIQRELSKQFDHHPIPSGQDGTHWGPTYRYKEWDANQGDYLHQHVIVRSREGRVQSSAFYRNALQKYSGLIKSIRYSFELLKPEGLKRLRRWREGDHFDYRALLDFTLDRKAGLMPSDRLYTKHLKQERDVAVLLLVDLSRSTANHVLGTNTSVLEVEKEAIVLFCEALEVLGDAFAIAGFSGNGRLGVDFYPVKHFSAPLNDEVRGKISALDSKRSTRMGAAIRHATALLGKLPAKVKLLILIGDGFPNDVGYKKEYAIQDTRRSILEALSKNILVHALTVNVAADTPLDELYGKAHHDIISDVRELPNKLLRLYGSLTKK